MPHRPKSWWRHANSDDLDRVCAGLEATIEDDQRSEQRRSAMAHVVVRDTFDVAQPQRQHGLSAFQRLALALLIDAQHQRVVRRVQVGAEE